MITSWECQLCGRERPDDKISVFSRPLVIGGQVCGQENIRYCNDSEDCATKAQNFSIGKG